ncbi:MAG: universal stress protein [Ilumatobacter sp.]|nr:universal stress protein [Ilumatobacter sp.]
MIVPVDGSHDSWKAFDVALALARAVDGQVEVVEIVSDQSDASLALKTMHERVAETDTTGIDVTTSVEVTGNDVVSALVAVFDRHEGSTFVMGSHGRGRSAALIGSVTDELLRTTYGPMVVVGPDAAVPDFTGPVVVTVDGSALSESAVSLAAAWSIELGSAVWIVQVLEPNLRLPPDVSEAVYTSRLAHRLTALTNRPVQTEVLHGRDPVDAVNTFAASVGASLIVAGTHGRTGAARLTMGSTVAGFVKHGPCPVLLIRPPHFPS